MIIHDENVPEPDFVESGKTYSRNYQQELTRQRMEKNELPADMMEAVDTVVVIIILIAACGGFFLVSRILAIDLPAMFDCAWTQPFGYIKCISLKDNSGWLFFLSGLPIYVAVSLAAKAGGEGSPRS